MSNKQKCRGVDVSELCFDKMSNEGFYNVLSRTKIRFGGFRGILRRFAKYRLLLYGEFSFLSGCVVGEEGDFCHSYYSSNPLFITFRFLDSTFLLESETRFFLLPFSKDLTSGHETKVFGGWNYIVWRVKLYCLARETILFRARFVCFSKTKCIVF